MRSLVLLLPFLLAAACTSTSSTPPPLPPEDPPAEGPFRWRYDEGTQGFLYTWPKPEILGRLVYAVYAEDPTGTWRAQWDGVYPYASEANPTYAPLHWLPGRAGTLVVYAYDTSGTYRQRRYQWRIPWRLEDSDWPWRFVAPAGPVVYTPLERFPWEAPGQTILPNTAEQRGSLNNTAVLYPFLACKQQARPEWGSPYQTRGIAATSFFVSGNDNFDYDRGVRFGPPNYTYQWRWVDRAYDGFVGAVAFNTLFLADPRDPNSDDPPQRAWRSLDNRTHEVVVLAHGLGIGPHKKPWEGRFFRLAGRGAGGFEENGRVRCEYGEWRIDEVTDPAVLAWVREWFRPQENRVDPPLGSPIHPGLIPEAWR